MVTTSKSKLRKLEPPYLHNERVFKSDSKQGIHLTLKLYASIMAFIDAKPTTGVLQAPEWTDRHGRTLNFRVTYSERHIF